MKNLKYLLIFISYLSYSQIGIGTTTPRGAVDIASTTQGFVLPTVSLAATNIQTAINPQGGAIPAGTVVYNNASAGAGATAVTPGMYYWDGTLWVSLTAGPTSTDWTILGNTGTNANTNFIGTTDNEDFRVRTNNTQRFNFSTNGRLRSYTDGTESAPLYTWNGDTNTGIYRAGADNLAFSAGGVRFLDLVEAAIDELVINEDSNNIDFRVESNNENATLFVDGGDDEVGLFTNNPQNDFHISGNNTGIRIDALNSVNNASNNGVDDSVIYVDANGDLLLKASLSESQIPEDNAVTFSPTPTFIDSPSGAFTAATLYTTTFTITRDALVEIVYQIGVGLAYSGGGVITDGLPRQYGTAVLINGTIVGYTSEAFTSNPDALGATVLSGTYFLNGNGYAQLAGAAGGTTYTVEVVGFVAGGDDGGFFPDGVEGEFGGNLGLDRFQIITHY